jgi:hypothetical protein
MGGIFSDRSLSNERYPEWAARIMAESASKKIEEPVRVTKKRVVINIDSDDDDVGVATFAPITRKKRKCAEMPKQYVDRDSVDPEDFTKGPDKIPYAKDEATPVLEMYQRAPVKMRFDKYHGDLGAFQFCHVKRCGMSEGCVRNCLPFRNYAKYYSQRCYLCPRVDSFDEQRDIKKSCTSCRFSVFQRWIMLESANPMWY